MKEIKDLLQADRIVHEPARLAILAILSTVEMADFKFLQTTLKLTQGNLSAHITKLEAAGFIDVEKAFVGKRASTKLRITKEGEKAFDRQTTIMKRFLRLLEV